MVEIKIYHKREFFVFRKQKSVNIKSLNITMFLSPKTTKSPALQGFSGRVIINLSRCDYATKKR